MELIEIIDYLSKITRTGNFQLEIASSSLDVGSKIYGIQVDDVNANALKLASNIARTAHSVVCTVF